MVKALEKAGFQHIMKHEDGRAVTVPVHRNQDLPGGTYRRILKDVELDDAEIRDLV